MASYQREHAQEVPQQFVAQIGRQQVGEDQAAADHLPHRAADGSLADCGTTACQSREDLGSGCAASTQ